MQYIKKATTTYFYSYVVVAFLSIMQLIRVEFRLHFSILFNQIQGLAEVSNDIIRIFQTY